MSTIATEIEVYVLAHTELAPGFYEYLEDYNRIWPSGYERRPERNEADWKLERPGEALAEFAGRQCYDSFDGDGAGAGRKSNKSYIQHIIEVGHGSVLEHASMSVLVRGGSRGFTHEQVRHRVGTAYSQGSTRYCDGNKFRFVMPKLVLLMLEKAYQSEDRDLIAHADQVYREYEIAHQALRDIYDDALHATQELAERIYGDVFDQSLQSQRTKLRKLVRSCARSTLPIGTEAPIVITQNYRQWRTALVQRGSEAAELEIREIYIKCLEILQERAPHVFGDFQVYMAPDGALACKTPYPKV